METELHPDIASIVYDESQIKAIVQDMGAQITRDYADKNPLVICILKGAIVAMADLMRAISIPMSCDFMAISSYGNDVKTSGTPRIIKDLNESVEGKHVIIVEDLLDSGTTLKYVTELLESRNPASIAIAAFLVKDVPDRACSVTPQYVGAHAPNEFLVGYGFDYAERYRNLPYVGVLKPSVYSD